MTNERSSDIDVLTVAAVAVVAYCLTNVIHEGLGHGLGCVLGGGQPKYLNAIYFSGETPVSGQRLEAAGGSLANLFFAGLGFLALRTGKLRPGTTTHYFVWLFATLNVLAPFGYLLFSGLGGFGDWARVVEGFQPVALFRIGLAVVGAGLYFGLAPRLVMPGLQPYLGATNEERRTRARKLSLLPYLVGGAAYVVAGLLNPEGWKLVLLSAAAASFGGESLLAWYPGIPPAGKWLPRPEHAVGVPVSWPWRVAGLVSGALFIGVLGRGVPLWLQTCRSSGRPQPSS